MKMIILLIRYFMKTRLSFVIDAHSANRLKAIAKTEERSYAQIIRMAVNYYLNHIESLNSNHAGKHNLIKSFAFSIDNNSREEIIKIADSQGISESHFIRKAIYNYIEYYENSIK